MNYKVISYSFTGNNETLAAAIASKLAAEHVKVSESRTRTFGTIAFDMLFNRTPKVLPPIKSFAENEMVIFVAPVWMGQAAAPLRAYFRSLKRAQSRYLFISISGGADGANPKLSAELSKRAGRPPVMIFDFHIKELLPAKPEPTREETSSYRLSEEEAEILSNKVVYSLEEITVGGQ